MAYSIAELPWLPKAPDDFSLRCKGIGASAQAGMDIAALAGHALNSRQSLVLSRAITRCRFGGMELKPLTPARLGVLASGTNDFVIDALPAAAARHGLALGIVTAPYDQVAQQALDPQSGIYASRLDAVLVAVDHHWLGLDTADLAGDPKARVASAVDRLASIVAGLRRHGNAAAILQTVPVPPQALFGSYDRRVPGTVAALIDEVNRSIVALAGETSSYLFDVAALASRIGADRWFDPVQWFSYKIPFAAECGPIYAEMLARLLGAIRGKAHKCLVLDLDNTLWGGVIGDDDLGGIRIGQGSAKGEAFLAVQRLARQYRERGIMLAVCSKNDDAVARRPFREHPEMLLKEEHISVFQANWLDKPSNVEAIARTLNIGLDALVLLDDNPAERAQMRAALPMVAVPELPDDPSWFAWMLDAAGYFEAVGFSAEDRMRSDAYAAEAHRAEVMTKSRSLGDYLTALDMAISFAPFDAQGRQRITQLINKTNQFNLTTRRFTEIEVAELEGSAASYTLQVRLKDRFGDLGMIGVVICHRDPDAANTWRIESWLMSCRVLGRCVEAAMLAEVVAAATQHGIRRLIGTYIPTAKNAMVADHYAKLGFAADGSDGAGATRWILDVSGYVPPSLPMRIEGRDAALTSDTTARSAGRRLPGQTDASQLMSPGMPMS